MILEDIYFDKSIRDYAKKLTSNNTEEADELVSLAFSICIEKPPKENMKGYFAMVMRNQWLKKYNKKDPIFHHESYDIPDIDGTLNKMNHYYANILKGIYNGENLTQMHKSAGIGYRTLKGDYKKAKKEFKIMYENKTKIAIVIQNVSGVSYHRLIVPIAKMARDYGLDVVCLQNKEDDFLDKLDGITHVIYNRNISTFMKPEEVIYKLKAKGIKVICDIDDYWILPKNHPMKYFYSKSKMDKCVVANIKHADQVWTTTKFLAEKISKYNKNVEVVKNAIDPLEKQFAYENLSIDFDTFFYSGGSTHAQDLKLLGNAFDNEELFAKAPSTPKNLSPIAIQLSGVAEYAKDYEDCGICVIPLKDNVFNSCKSELKLIEAGHFAKPVLVSHVKPYTLLATNKNSIKVYNNDWTAAIGKIKGNHQLQVDLGLKLKEDVSLKYNIVKENAKRLQTL